MLLLSHGERLIDIINFSPRVLQNVFSYCNKSVCYSCLQICNIWNWYRKHFALNIPPWKEFKWGDIRWSWWPGCRTISPNPPVWKCYVQKPTNIQNPVWRHHLVGKLSTAETLLTEVQCKVPTYLGSFLVINVCNQGKNLCSSCI